MIGPRLISVRRPLFQVCLAAADAGAACLALHLATAARRYDSLVDSIGPPGQAPPTAPTYAALAAIVLGAYAAMGLYRIRRGWEWRHTALSVTLASAAATALYLASCYLARDHSVSRLVLTLLWGLTAVMTLALRLAAREAVRWCSRNGVGVKRVVLVGDNPVADTIAREIEGNPHAGLALAGRAAPRESSEPAARLRSGTMQDVVDELLRCRPHRVIFALDIAEHEELQALAERCLSENIEVLQVPHLYHSYPGQVVLKELIGMPLLGFGNHGLDGWELIGKEVLDRLVAGLLLALTAPLALLLALAVRAGTKGPILRRRRRAGRGGVPFQMLEFEIERAGPDRDGRHPTRLGTLLARSGLRRLPTLLNVLGGQMSLVGPRPDSPEGARRLNEWQRPRLSVKPGLTGLAQLCGHSAKGDVDGMVRDDLRYIEEQSLLLDLRILSGAAWRAAGLFRRDRGRPATPAWEAAVRPAPRPANGPGRAAG